MVNIKRDLKLDVDGMAYLMALAYPGKGFSISDDYDGISPYEKMVMADRHPKPSFEDIIHKAELLNFNIIES